MKTEQYDVVVIGGGPAGLAAALAAGKVDASLRVAIVERDHYLGGILPQCIHNGFGLKIFKQDLTGPEYAERYIEQVAAADIEVKLETMVIDLQATGLTCMSRAEGITRVQAGAVVLAMGCRERTRGALAIPGTRPAGIFTAGLAQRFINIEGYLPGRRVVILGSGDVGLIMARRLTLEGATVEAVVEVMPFLGGLTRNKVQCLDDYGIPLYLQHTVTDVMGHDRVEGVRIARVDHQRRPVPDTEWQVDCDTLLLSVGLIPENELTQKAGLQLSPLTGGPEVDQFQQTLESGLFACGNVLFVCDLVDDVSLMGERAGISAAAHALEQATERPPRRLIPVRPGRNVATVLPQHIDAARLTDEVTVLLRCREPQRDARILAVVDGQEIARSSRKRMVRPGESERLSITGASGATDEGLAHLADAVSVELHIVEA